MPLKKGKILLLDEPHPMARAIMEEVAECWDHALFPWTKDAEKINDDNVSSTIGIYTQFRNIPSDCFPFNDTLKFIACPCTSTEHIKVPEGVKLIHLDDEWKRTEGLKITSTAEHTFSLILQLAKMNKMQLSGKTLGIIGTGRIGMMVFEYAKTFGMKVLWCDKKGTRIYTFEEVLSQSDIITLHVPLNDSTRSMIGAEQFNMMKDGALLVNTSRAEIVDEKALSQALSTYGKFGGYADDFEDKHSDEIQECYKTILTDHVAGDTKESRMMTDIFIAEKVKQFILNSKG